MSSVFISYKRIAPDQDFARLLASLLERTGHRVFLDIAMPVGTDWTEEIQRQIQTAEYFVVLLSETSVRSDMVRQEVELARDGFAQGRTLIFPVRLAYSKPLPYDLAAYLHRLQFATWDAGTPMEKICAEIVSAIDSRSVLPPPEGLAPDAVAEHEEAREHDSQAPFPNADTRPLLETGTLSVKSRFYVRRDADDVVLNGLLNGGATITVKAPRQFGKSSLAVRAHARVKPDFAFACYLDFQLFETSDLATLRDLLACIARNIEKAIRRRGTTIRGVRRPWRKDGFTEFLEDNLLAGAELPVLLIFDEVDRVFSRDFRDDFFSMIRGWHNLRALQDNWERLNILIAHSTEPALWIRDLNQSPFNVGLRLSLDGFSFVQVSNLNRSYGAPLRSEDEVRRFRDLVGGQPYLVRQGLYTLASQGMDLQQLEKAAPDPQGPFADHLARILWGVHRDPELRDALREVFATGSCSGELAFQRLISSGLVIGSTRREVSLRSPLYDKHLRQHL